MAETEAGSRDVDKTMEILKKPNFYNVCKV